MTSVRGLIAIAAAVSLASQGCGPVTHDVHRSLDRQIHNSYVRECERGSPEACFNVGENLSGHSAESRGVDWSERVDLEAAFIAYAMGCKAGNARSCRAILERNLVKDENERELWMQRALVLGAPPRSDALIAAEEREIAEEVAKNNEQIEAQYDKEKARLDEQNREALAGAAAGLGAIANGQDPSIAMAKSSAGGDSAESNVNGVFGSGGSTGNSPCSPCAQHANLLQQRCAQPQSAACYCEAAAMHTCVASAPGCATDAAAERAEAGRMRNAAREVGGACL